MMQKNCCYLIVHVLLVGRITHTRVYSQYCTCDRRQLHVAQLQSSIIIGSHKRAVVHDEEIDRIIGNIILGM